MFGLSLYTGEKEIRELFSKYGPIEQVQVVYDHQTGRSRGFAFIYYEDIDDAIDVSETEKILNFERPHPLTFSLGLYLQSLGIAFRGIF